VSGGGGKCPVTDQTAGCAVSDTWRRDSMAPHGADLSKGHAMATAGPLPSLKLNYGSYVIILLAHKGTKRCSDTSVPYPGSKTCISGPRLLQNTNYKPHAVSRSHRQWYGREYMYIVSQLLGRHLV